MNTQTVQDLLHKQEEKGKADSHIDSLRALRREVRQLMSDLRLDGSDRDKFDTFAEEVDIMMAQRAKRSRQLAFDIGQAVYDASQDERERNG